MVERKTIVNFRVTKTEQRMLQALADKEGEAVSVWLRQLVRSRFEQDFNGAPLPPLPAHGGGQ
jgi:hypothetical protein